jgi:ubiquitin carboxyl-terminal hydrolase 8
LRTASEAIERAKDLDEREPDRAYIQYLRASEITINIIPHHWQYKTTITERPGWYKEFADLMQAVRRKQGTMDAIKQQIIDDNLESNVPPTGLFGSQPYTSAIPRGRNNQAGSNSMRMPSPTQFQQASDSPK